MAYVVTSYLGLLTYYIHKLVTLLHVILYSVTLLYDSIILYYTILYDCEFVKQERNKLKVETLRSQNWPVSKDTLINKYTKFFFKICRQLTP